MECKQIAGCRYFLRFKHFGSGDVNTALRRWPSHPRSNVKSMGLNHSSEPPLKYKRMIEMGFFRLFRSSVKFSALYSFLFLSRTQQSLINRGLKKSTSAEAVSDHSLARRRSSAGWKWIVEALLSGTKAHYRAKPRELSRQS